MGEYQLAWLGWDREVQHTNDKSFQTICWMDIETGGTLGADAGSSGSKWPLIILVKSPHMVVPQ